MAILALENPRAGVWARVGGDALDLAALASGFTEDNPEEGEPRRGVRSRRRHHGAGLLVREAARERPAARLRRHPSGQRRRRLGPALPARASPHRTIEHRGLDLPAERRQHAEPCAGTARATSASTPSPTRRSRTRATRSSRSRPPRICGSDLHLLRRLHADDGGGRHPRPRADGRGRRGRQATSRSSRRATASSCRSPSPAASAGSARRTLFSLLRHDSNPNAEIARKVMGQSPGRPVRLLAHARRLRRRPGRVPPRAVRRRRPAQDPRAACPTRRCCSSPTSSRPATWPPRTPRSSRATRSPSGAAGRSASSPSRAPGCSAPGG